MKPISQKLNLDFILDELEKCCPNEKYKQKLLQELNMRLHYFDDKLSSGLLDAEQLKIVNDAKGSLCKLIDAVEKFTPLY